MHPFLVQPPAKGGAGSACGWLATKKDACRAGLDAVISAAGLTSVGWREVALVWRLVSDFGFGIGVFWIGVSVQVAVVVRLAIGS